MRRFLVLTMVLAVAAPVGQASHLGMYASMPVEHDDQGRSVEPDFASTAVLGPLVTNAVVDQDMDGVAVPDPQLPRPFPGLTDRVAPGCTDDAGRRPSGLCGVWNIRPSGSTEVCAHKALLPLYAACDLVGVRGMSGGAAPGAFTPTKNTQVRFLDARINTQVTTYGSTYLELNRKVDDAAEQAGPSDPQDFTVGPSAVWAWYGRWQDKNGNGVIDSFYDATMGNQHPVAPYEEFLWFGNCEAFPDVPNPESVVAGYCAYDTEAAAGGRTEMLAYLFPGNHHAYNGDFDIDPLLCALCLLPSDLPARQVIHFLGSNGVPVCTENNPVGGFGCGTSDLQEFDANDEASYGDPLLGPQGSVAPDGAYRDQSGDPGLRLRDWFVGPGWPMWFYDQSLAVTLVHVTVVGCARGTSNGVDLDTCRFADVDAYATLHPELEQLIQGTVKPELRGRWTFVRDRWTPLVLELGDATHHPLLRAGLPGVLDDALWNPGWSREPNDAGDAFPAATRGTGPDPQAQHHGWYNDYDAHQAAPRAFGDLQAARVLVVFRPIGVANCIMCVAGVFVGTDYAGESAGTPVPVRAPGDHRRTLGPGQYEFRGLFGLWQDKPQTWQEATLDPLTLSWVSRAYTVPPDGWVGNIVNATGAYFDRGYPLEECTTDQGTGLWPFAWCHPYMDGALQDPQQMWLGEPMPGEFRGRCDDASDIELTPQDGRWDVPVFVWRDHLNHLDLGNLGETLARIEDHTGSGGPITLRGPCRPGVQGGGLWSSDLLELPLGNLGETFEARVTVRVGAETVTDADTYHGWGSP